MEVLELVSFKSKTIFIFAGVIRKTQGHARNDVPAIDRNFTATFDETFKDMFRFPAVNH